MFLAIQIIGLIVAVFLCYVFVFTTIARTTTKLKDNIKWILLGSSAVCIVLSCLLSLALIIMLFLA